MKKDQVFWTILLIIGMFKLQIVCTLSGWTKWQNTDHPDDGGGDKEEGYFSCGPHNEATTAECRVVGKGIVFTKDTAFLAPDVLFWPCTRKGVLCRNHDQEIWQTCHDYEIRFFCPEIKSEDDVSQFWLIALVGASCIAVPLLIVVALQCLRDLKRNHHSMMRRQQSARTRSSNLEAAAVSEERVQAPPSYETLFGSTDFHFTTQNTHISHNTVDSQYSGISSVNNGCTNNAFEHEDNIQNADRNTSGNYDPISQISSSAIYENVLPQQNQTQPIPSEVSRDSARNTSQHTPSSLHVPEMQVSAQTGDVTPPPSYNDVIKYSDIFSTKVITTVKNSQKRPKRFNSL